MLPFVGPQWKLFLLLSSSLVCFMLLANTKKNNSFYIIRFLLFVGFLLLVCFVVVVFLIPPQQLRSHKYFTITVHFLPSDWENVRNHWSHKKSNNKKLHTNLPQNYCNIIWPQWGLFEQLIVIVYSWICRPNISNCLFWNEKEKI